MILELGGCGIQVEQQNAQYVQETRYDGPLYEISFTSMEEKLDGFGKFSITAGAVNVSNVLDEIILVEELEAKMGTEEFINHTPGIIWYRMDYQSIAPEGYTVSEELKQNLTGGNSPTILKYHETIQSIPIMLDKISDAKEMTITVTVGDISRVYTPTEEDYTVFTYGTISSEPMLDITVYTSAEGQATVATDWIDANSNSYTGYYAFESYTLTDDPIPYYS